MVIQASDSFENISPQKQTSSPKMDDRIPSDKKKSLETQSLVCNINLAYNKTVSNKRKLQHKASITKSLVEDASEDFSNIEEHISSF